MKTDLATSILVAVIGVAASYFACNYFFGPIDAVEITTVDTSIGADYDEPNVEVFNYKALNPTVEVFVGDCTEFNEQGECLDNTRGQ